jgi:hypothetical protein
MYTEKVEHNIGLQEKSPVFAEIGAKSAKIKVRTLSQS